MQMMNYEQCFAYVMDNKLRTYHNEISGVWQVTDEKHYIGASDYCAAVNTWKARYGEPCDTPAGFKPFEPNHPRGCGCEDCGGAG